MPKSIWLNSCYFLQLIIFTIKEINVISYTPLHRDISKVGKMLTISKIIVSNMQWKSQIPFKRMYCPSSRTSLKWWEWKFIRIPEQFISYYHLSVCTEGINQIEMNLRCAQIQFHFIDQFSSGSERRGNMCSLLGTKRSYVFTGWQILVYIQDIPKLW